jgi:hypothetical protein
VLLIEHFNNEFGFSTGSAVRSATTKGIVIHTAYDLTDSPATTGPDYTSGWGLLDAAAAATFITNSATPGATDSLFEATYAGSAWSQQVDWGGSDPLKVTMVWTDPAGTANTGGLDDDTPALVNDLDLWVTGPGGTYYPWTLDPENPGDAAVRTTANHLDNVEQVLIDSPSSGVYTIHSFYCGFLTSWLTSTT